MAQIPLPAVKHPEVTGAVLAGGLARRMGGIDKALLSAMAGLPGTILSSILGTFEGRFAETLVVASRQRAEGAAYAALPVRVVTDRFEGCGPLAGIHAALSAASTPLVFVCGCDMPSLSGPLIDLMAEQAVRAGRDSLLVPVLDGRPEPLHAVYPRRCLPEVERALSEGVRKMSDFFERVPVEWLPRERFLHVEGAIRSFQNMNTPEDLEAWR